MDEPGEDPIFPVLDSAGGHMTVKQSLELSTTTAVPSACPPYGRACSGQLGLEGEDLLVESLDRLAECLHLPGETLVLPAELLHVLGPPGQQSRLADLHVGCLSQGRDLSPQEIKARLDRVLPLVFSTGDLAALRTQTLQGLQRAEGGLGLPAGGRRRDGDDPLVFGRPGGEILRALLLAGQFVFSSGQPGRRGSFSLEQ